MSRLKFEINKEFLLLFKNLLFLRLYFFYYFFKQNSPFNIVIGCYNSNYFILKKTNSNIFINCHIVFIVLRLSSFPSDSSASRITSWIMLHKYINECTNLMYLDPIVLSLVANSVLFSDTADQKGSRSFDDDYAHNLRCA